MPNPTAANLTGKISIDMRAVSAAQRSFNILIRKFSLLERPIQISVRTNVDTSNAERSISQLRSSEINIAATTTFDDSSVQAGINRLRGESIEIPVQTGALPSSGGQGAAGLGIGAGGLRALANPYVAVTAGVTALGAASVAAGLDMQKMTIELQKQATLAGVSVNEIQRLGYASEKVGVSQEKFSDILKDVNDRVGEFTREMDLTGKGTGEFAEIFTDLLAPMGLTIDELKAMTSDQVMGAVINSFDELGISTQQQTTYLEQLANDATALIPLFEDNSRLLNEYKDAADRSGVIIDNDELRNAEKAKGIISEYSNAFVSAKQEAGNLFNNWVIGTDAVLDATGKLIDNVYDWGAEVTSTQIEFLGLTDAVEALPPLFGELTGFIGDSVEEALKFAGIIDGIPEKFESNIDYKNFFTSEELAILQGKGINFKDDGTIDNAVTQAKQLAKAQEEVIKKQKEAREKILGQKTGTTSTTGTNTSSITTSVDTEKQRLLLLSRYEIDLAKKAALEKQIAVNEIDKQTLLDEQEKADAKLKIEQDYQNKLKSIREAELAQSKAQADAELAYKQQAINEQLAILPDNESNSSKIRLLQKQQELLELEAMETLSAEQIAKRKAEIEAEYASAPTVEADVPDGDSITALFDSITQAGQAAGSSTAAQVSSIASSVSELANLGIAATQSQILNDPTIPWYTKLATAVGFAAQAAGLFSGVSGVSSSSGSTSTDSTSYTANEAPDGGTVESGVAGSTGQVVNVVVNNSVDPVTGEYIADVMSSDPRAVNAQISTVSNNKTAFKGAMS